MTSTQTHEPTPRKPIRLWPGVAIVALQWLIWLVGPMVVPALGAVSILGAVAGGLALLLWWLLFSRAPWSERVGAIVLMVGAVVAMRPIVHASISNGLMGRMLPLFSIPVFSLALVAGLLASRHLSRGPRRVSILAAVLIACGAATLVRVGGITGDAMPDLHWRWTPTPEERLLARTGEAPATSSPAAQAAVEPPAAPAGGSPAAAASAPPTANAPEKGGAQAEKAPAALPTAPSVAAAEPDWPGFRGPARDGIVRGVRIETDWSKSPPVELWRRPVGPGWSSFAVRGDRVFTQEQRGDDEIVACYHLKTGKPVWMHRDATRFWESNGGAGPRGTPTLSNGRVFTLGATGILNALDAGTGAVVWSRNVAADTKVETPGWGFTGSPLVVGDAVIVAASGQLAAYDAATGQPRWLGPEGGAGYSSPHLLTIHGVAQVLLLRGARTTSVAPADGALLWEHKGQPSVSIVQPAQAAGGDVLVSPGDAMGGTGMRRLAVAHGPAGWTVEERWTSQGLKPYFNDFVVHKGQAFGFDGSILASIDLADGKRKWKGGRYGHGQMILLPDQDLLLVLSEEGELALVGANPDQYTELARFKVIEGKTWNHPVLVGDVLLVRNAEEMAAFRLPLASR